jgi:hypothetical protein
MNRLEEYNKKYGEHLIGLDEYKCVKCRKVWQPTDKDINKKAMMTYYKNCGVCRLYLYNKCIEYRNRDK